MDASAAVFGYAKSVPTNDCRSRFEELSHCAHKPQLTAVVQSSAGEGARVAGDGRRQVGSAANLRAEVIAPRADGHARLEIAAEVVRKERCSAGFLAGPNCHRADRPSCWSRCCKSRCRPLRQMARGQAR